MIIRTVAKKRKLTDDTALNRRQCLENNPGQFIILLNYPLNYCNLFTHKMIKYTIVTFMLNFCTMLFAIPDCFSIETQHERNQSANHPCFQLWVK